VKTGTDPFGFHFGIELDFFVIVIGRHSVNHEVGAAGRCSVNWDVRKTGRVRTSFAIIVIRRS
jgi:hypothetical protein